MRSQEVRRAASMPNGALVIVAMLATGTIVGTINGLVYVYGRLPHPFIVTLATLSIARGLALWLSGGQPLQGMPQIVQDLGGGSLGWFPFSAFLVAGLALLGLLLTKRMVWGRWIYAVGGNPEAARRTGIPTRGVLVSVYVVSGFAAALGSAMFRSHTRTYSCNCASFSGLVDGAARSFFNIGSALPHSLFANTCIVRRSKSGERGCWSDADTGADGCVVDWARTSVDGCSARMRKTVRMSERFLLSRYSGRGGVRVILSSENRSSFEITLT